MWCKSLTRSKLHRCFQCGQLCVMWSFCVSSLASASIQLCASTTLCLIVMCNSVFQLLMRILKDEKQYWQHCMLLVHHVTSWLYSASITFISVVSVCMLVGDVFIVHVSLNSRLFLFNCQVLCCSELFYEICWWFKTSFLLLDSIRKMATFAADDLQLAKNTCSLNFQVTRCLHLSLSHQSNMWYLLLICMSSELVFFQHSKFAWSLTECKLNSFLILF